MKYYGKDPRSTSLKHWKYIEKKTINGKTHYYYADTNNNKDNSGFKIGRSDKYEVNMGWTKKNKRYRVKTPEANKNGYVDVKKDVYDKVSSGHHLYYNNQRVSSIVGKKVEAGASYVRKKLFKIDRRAQDVIGDWKIEFKTTNK